MSKTFQENLLMLIAIVPFALVIHAGHGKVEKYNNLTLKTQVDKCQCCEQCKK